MSVLIVEDEGPIRNLIAAVLKRERIEADTAENGREALLMLDRRRYDCIILDLMMPILDGRGVIEWLQDHPRRPPVVLLTAAGENMTADLPPSVVKVVLRKPFDLGRLIEVVRAFVAAAEMRAADREGHRPPLM
jgi:DNA-binding response OmpR family regulator